MRSAFTLPGMGKSWRKAFSWAAADRDRPEHAARGSALGNSHVKVSRSVQKPTKRSHHSTFNAHGPRIEILGGNSSATFSLGGKGGKGRVTSPQTHAAPHSAGGAA